MLKITSTGEAVTFGVHVQPRASRNEICGVMGDELKIRLTSPPVEDAANRLCVEFLAKLLKVAKTDVAIIAGTRSRHKTIRVNGCSADQLRSLVEAS